MQALLLLTWLSAAGWAAPENGALEGALHLGQPDSERVRWTSDLRFKKAGEVDLAWPLEAELHRCLGAEPLLDAEGRLVGLRVDEAGLVHLELSAPLDPELLQPPLALDEYAAQRVILDEAWYRAGPESGLTWGMSHQSAPEIGGSERRALNHATWSDARHVGKQPLFLVADAELAELHGIPGELRRAGEVPAQTAAGVGGLFALALAGLFAAFQGLKRLERKEQVERYVRTELGVQPE
ncbi:MAG: hypothetical protein H6740_24170 [Alphaproteobacteria bacterium]|nr:hypothetical protein [Alphaproteobacteria bacterium]